LPGFPACLGSVAITDRSRKAFRIIRTSPRCCGVRSWLLRSVCAVGSRGPAVFSIHKVK
jgi:hypothetical protein